MLSSGGGCFLVVSRRALHLSSITLTLLIGDVRLDFVQVQSLVKRIELVEQRFDGRELVQDWVLAHIFVLELHQQIETQEHTVLEHQVLFGVQVLRHL